MDDDASPIYGTVGYQAPEIARLGPDGRVRPVHGRAHARGAVHRLPGLPEDVPVDAPAARQRCRSSPSTTRSTACCSRRPRRDPTTASSRPTRWPTSSSASCARSSRARRARPRPRPSTLFTRRPPGASRSARLAPAPRAAGRHRRPGGRLSRHASPPPTPPTLAELLRAAPDRTVEVDLRLARALIEAGDAGRGRRAHRRRSRRTTPGSGGPSGTAGSSSSPATGRGPRQPFFRSVYRAVPGELAPKLALGVGGRGGAHARRGGRVVRRRLAHRSARTPRRRSGWPAAALRSATGPGRSRPTTGSRAARAPTPRRRSPGSTASPRPTTEGRPRSPTSPRPTRRCAACSSRASSAPASPPSSSRRRSGHSRGLTPRRAPARAWPATRSSSATCAPGWRATTATSPAWRRPRASASGWSTAPTTFARGRGHDPGRRGALRGVPCPAAARRPLLRGMWRARRRRAGRDRRGRGGMRAVRRGGRRARCRRLLRGLRDAPPPAGQPRRGRSGVGGGGQRPRARASPQRGRVPPRAGAGRGHRGRLRRHLHVDGQQCRVARRRRRSRAPCSPRPCATAPTSSARRRTPPTPRTGPSAACRRPACRLAVPSCTLICAVCTERRDHGRLDRRQPRVLDRRGRRAPAHGRRLVGPRAGRRGLLEPRRGGTRPARARDHALGRRGRPGRAARGSCVDDRARRRAGSILCSDGLWNYAPSRGRSSRACSRPARRGRPVAVART